MASILQRKYVKKGDVAWRNQAFATFACTLGIVSLPGRHPFFTGPLSLRKPSGRHVFDPLVPNHQRHCIFCRSSRSNHGSSSTLAATVKFGVVSAACAALSQWCHCCGRRAMAAAAAVSAATTLSTTASSSARASVSVIAKAGNSPAVPTRRVVSIGDLHGDFEQTKLILERLGLMARDGSWAGGDTVLVQTGDVTDRGDASGPIYQTLFRLQDEAPQQGGEVILLLGNHEVMNMQGDFRYATQMDTMSLRTPGGRSEAFSPKGWVGQRLRNRAKTAVVLGKDHGIAKPVLFVHAGIVPAVARAARDAAGPNASAAEVAEALNRISRDALANDESGGLFLGNYGPFWTRELALRSEATACEKLEEVLQTFGAARMVVGHTPQEDGRVHTRCGGRLVLGDTLISAAYTGVAHPSALEIASDGSMTAVYPKTGERFVLPLDAAQNA